MNAYTTTTKSNGKTFSNVLIIAETYSKAQLIETLTDMPDKLDGCIKVSNYEASKHPIMDNLN
jgi:hypothetical protein